MDIEVKLPELGEESIDAARISFFYAEEGEEVKEGDDLVELLTDKATFNIQAPATGKVKKILAEENQEVKVGGLLAVIETPD